MGAVETPTSTRPRDDLVGHYSEYDLTNQGLVAYQVAPSLPVQRESGVYGIVPRETYLSLEDTKTAPNAATRSSSWNPESDSFLLASYEWAEFAGRRMSDIYRDWFQMDEIATERVAGIVERDYERDVANAVFNLTTFAADGVTGETLASGSEFDHANGLPLSTIETAKKAILDNYGVMANALILPWGGLRAFSLSAQVRATLTPNMVTPGLLPHATVSALTGLKKVIVPHGVYNSAKPGQTPVMTKFWSDDLCMVGYIPDGGTLDQPCIARTFHLASGPGGENLPEMDSWETPNPKGTWVRARKVQAAKLPPTPIGYLIRNVLV